MSQPHSTRDMSTLVGTSKTLERAISGLQMSSARLASLIAAEESSSAGLTGLMKALGKLSTEDQTIVDAILSHRSKHKRKTK